MKLASTDIRPAQFNSRRKSSFSVTSAMLLTLAGSVGFNPAIVLAQSSPPALPSASVAAPDQSSPPVTELAPASAADADPVLPHDLTPIGMFMAADKIVKAVMIGLAFASVVTWSVWLAKVIELFSARRKLLRDLHTVEHSQSLTDSCEKLRGANSDIALLARAADGELQRSRDAMNHDGVKERVASIFSRIEAASTRRMTRGTGILATIGSTGPFVGLFGTVWGIMNAFIGISKSQTTNLAVVAPGIAEALLATALGLVAAIPAVMIYNMFARKQRGDLNGRAAPASVVGRRNAAG
jgi:biopolymer transport protein ExbB